MFFILWPNFPNAETEAQREEVVFLTDSVEVPVTYQENDKSKWGRTKPWGTAGGQPKGVLLSSKEHTSRRVQLEAGKESHSAGRSQSHVWPGPHDIWMGTDTGH